jgi:hypothetical protein
VTALPTVVETSPVSDDLATDMVVDRFLARVAALTPAEWGTLDAIGQRAGAGDPISRWRRARRYLGAIESPAARDALAVVGAAGGWILDLGATVEQTIEQAFVGRRAQRERWRQLSDRTRAEQARVQRAARAREGSPTASRIAWETARLVEIATAQPRGPGEATSVLAVGLLALRLRPRLTARAFAEMYELVEPVIPAASL